MYFIGFYTEHSPSASLPNQSSVSSISTNDCTIDSVDTPSPIILNNSISSEASSHRNPFITTQSSGSDSVFSSTESYTVDQRVRAKLEAIHEKSLNDMADDLEEGISFMCMRRHHSDGEITNQSQNVVQETPEETDVSIHKKRKTFARMKSHSFDEENLTQLIKDQLGSHNNIENNKSLQPPPPQWPAPPIITTDMCHGDSVEPLIPKQADGMLQVSSPVVIDGSKANLLTNTKTRKRRAC